MAYNSDKDASAGYISHEHLAMLRRLMKHFKRTKRATLEYLIEQAEEASK